MSNSSTPSGTPGVGTMTDTLEFVKNMWGGMKIPGMVMPTLSVDDINKQISDLKAVESWLTLNMNMLRGTIQALEVQSATLATLQAMSANMNAMMQATRGAEPAESPDVVSPFSSAAPAAENTVADATSHTSPDINVTGMAAPFANPAVWWNVLQDQFKQAVNTAVAPEPESPPAKPESPPAKPAPSSRRKSPKP